MTSHHHACGQRHGSARPTRHALAAKAEPTSGDGGVNANHESGRPHDQSVGAANCLVPRSWHAQMRRRSRSGDRPGSSSTALSDGVDGARECSPSMVTSGVAGDVQLARMADRVPTFAHGQREGGVESAVMVQERATAPGTQHGGAFGDRGSQRNSERTTANFSPTTTGWLASPLMPMPVTGPPASVLRLTRAKATGASPYALAGVSSSRAARSARSTGLPSEFRAPRSTAAAQALRS